MTISQDEIQELTEPIQRFNLWIKVSSWLPNDKHNEIITKYYVKWIGTEQELKTLTGGGCQSCNKWIQIYRAVNRYLKKNGINI
jgi:hypothetical protein